MERVVVLGGGSAGLLTALTLKKRLPGLIVKVYRSEAIGVIGVGEGTTPSVTKHLHEYLQIPFDRFLKQASPTFKIGLRLDWGKRSHFNYSFGRQVIDRYHPLPRTNGFYCEEDFTAGEPITALMDAGKAFPNSRGNPLWSDFVAYHLENETFVDFLERECALAGVEIHDAMLEGVESDEHGVTRLRFDGGRSVEADLYVDASGFKSLLLSETMKAPYVDFSGSLFCDRAVVGGWDRTTEPILAYTRAETMDAGWCWQIEHEHKIIRGYVYSSKFISDDAADAEFRAKNPKLTNTRVIKFKSGFYSQSWIGNVVAVGNSCGFVEPLEATSLMIICDESRFLAESLIGSNQCPTPSVRAGHNRLMENEWESIRGFLAIHYKFNERRDTPFWRAARADTDLAETKTFVEFYQDNGPMVYDEKTLLKRHDIFGLEGHMTMMLGQQVPYLNRQPIQPFEWKTWRSIQDQNRKHAGLGFDVRQTLEGLRSGNMRFVIAAPPK
ncbi:MAG TPA: tryptophan 7-halogenase [Tepidisphaeraceae bacterium]|nr:tryptophan 7-halogenase [Tepidisphaeraceae bacterium]